MRIRNIKPEFWRSEDIKRLSREDRLLFVGLWSYVDDNGVGIDDHRQIAADLFPIEDDPIEVREFVREGLQRIAGGSLCTRYEFDGKAFLFINSWAKHQKVHNPNKARYPLPNGIVAHPTSAYVGSTESLPSIDGDSTETLGTGSEGQGVRGTEEKDSASTDQFDAFWAEYPRKDGKAAALKAWPKACKKLEPPRLVAAARYWAGLWKAAGQEKSFIPHASTWLNGERWNDEPPSPRASPKTNGHHVPYRNPDNQDAYDEELL